MITDTTQGLFDLAEKRHVTFKGCDLDRKKLASLVQNYTRSFHLALAFCRTADCGYETMYEDLERFIRMGGKEPPLRILETPQETALLLLATERHFARLGIEEPLRLKLRHYADIISNYKNMEALQNDFAGNLSFRHDINRSKQLAQEAAGSFSLLETLSLIEAQMEQAYKLPSRSDMRKNRSL